MGDSASPRFDQLAHAAFSYPIIDNHAHNILKATHRAAVPFEGLTSEASGEALSDAVHSVAMYRATAQLARLFGCEPTLAAVQAARDAMSYDSLCELCFKPTGIVALLLDDGLDKVDELCYDVASHARFASAATKRIVRVEVVAQTLIRELHEQHETDLATFFRQFKALLIDACHDPQVAGFKSVACYRTGLNIEKHGLATVAAQYSTALSDLETTGNLRLAHKALNDYIVRLTLSAAGKYGKPVQFHTGLGDNDIRLVSATPAVMQPVIEEYPDTNFVLLHSSYPFTQEAGYLASVYKNVYLDFGEVFPMVSADGQRTILRQVLEIAPTTKILWSTDGHWWPETYYLAALQVRAALYEVLADAVARGDMSEPQAVRVVQRALFDNANALYGLRLPPPEAARTLPLPPALAPPPLPALAAPAPAPPTLADLAARGIRFVRIHWVDYCAVVRYRAVPLARLQRMARPGVGVVKAALGIVRLALAAPLGPAGEFLLAADLRSLRVCPYAPGHAFVMGSFEEKEPVQGADGAAACAVDVDPRTVLQRVVRAAKEQDDLDFLVGFEIEFILLVPDAKFPTPVNEHDYAVSAALPSGSAAAKTLDEIAAALEAAGIELEQYHAEGAHGQYEVVTGPLPPLQAADALIATRETIFHVAARNGLHATFTPRLFPHQPGSALHTHISVTSSSPRASEPAEHAPTSALEGSFLQGVLDRLPALCALTLPAPASYARVADGVWAGGTWAAWGRENREAPLRLCGGGGAAWHVEVRAVDGTANAHLALAALLRAGAAGVRKRLPLRTRDCRVAAAGLSDAERAALGITTRMPRSLEEAVARLRADGELTAMLGAELVATYISAIELRRDIVSKESEEGQREWMAKFY